MVAQASTGQAEVVLMGCGAPNRGMGWYHAEQMLRGDVPSAKLCYVVEPWFLGAGKFLTCITLYCSIIMAMEACSQREKGLRTYRASLDKAKRIGSFLQDRSLTRTEVVSTLSLRLFLTYHPLSLTLHLI
jgi:hypothetical protein